MAPRRMTLRWLLLWAALGWPGLSGLAAQQTADKARLIFSVGLGQNSGGGFLWQVPRQPFLTSLGDSDTLSVSRLFRNSMSIVFSGTYFPGDNLGVGGEVRLIGLGTSASCGVHYTWGLAEAPDACAALNGQEYNSSSVMMAVSGVYRIGSQAPIHPYARAGAGLVYSPESFIRTRSDLGLEMVSIYEDQGHSNLTPALTLGGGVVIVASPGYQVRFEITDNWMRLPAVTAPTPLQGAVPRTGSVSRHLLSVNLFFDVVLERRRGRRY